MVVSHQMSVLLTDVEGSTRLWETDPEQMAAVLADHDRLLREVIAAHSGRVFGTAGDSFAAAFPTVADAVEAAVVVQRETGRLSVGDLPLRLRMGIHYGEIELRGDDYFGPVMNRTGRVRDTAHGGQIVLTHTAYDHLDGQPSEITFIDLGEHRLRDLSAPVRLHQLCAPGLETDFPPVKSLGAFIHNLPTQLTSFIGRSDELNLIDKLLSDTRHATLLGPAGSGKTRLALQAAADTVHRYDDGVWFVDFRDLRDPDEVGPSIASALRVPTDVGRPVNDQLVDALWHRQLLLILDNCEHVLDTVSPLVDRLLQRQGTTRVVATTREPLGLPGESIVPVGTLAVPGASDLRSLEESEAALLFTDRAQQASPTFTLGDHTQAVFDICRACDGLPLALELAAARLRALTPATIAGRLGSQLTLLKTKQRTGDPRHTTIEATIDWSWQLLTEHEQILFCRLSIFRGTWSLEAAEAICGDRPIDSMSVMDLLTSLVEKSLVSPADSDPTTSRFRMLEPIRQFAAERLDPEQLATLTDRCVDYWSSALPEERGYATWSKDWFDRAWKLQPDRANLFAAMEWALAAERYETAARIFASPFGHLMALEGSTYFETSTGWIDRVLEHRTGVSPDILFSCLSPIAAVAAMSYQNERWLRYARLGIELSPTRDDEYGWKLAEAVATNRSGRQEEAEPMFDRIFEDADDPALRASALIGKSQFAAPEDAWELMQRATALSSFDSLPFWDEVYATASVGAAALQVGRYGVAGTLLERSLELANSWHYLIMECHAAFMLSSVYAATGRLNQSFAVLEEALSRTRRLVGPNVTTAGVRLRASQTARLLGNLDEAQHHVDEAYRAADRDDMLYWRLAAAANEALIARDRGNNEGARSLLEDAIQQAESLEHGKELAPPKELWSVQAGVALRDGDPDRAAKALLGFLARPEWLSHLQKVSAVDLTSVALSQLSFHEVAARLFGAADRERERTGLVVEPPDRPLLDQAKERVRSQLGDGWDAEYERGRTMSLDEAVELATEMATRLSDDS